MKKIKIQSNDDSALNKTINREILLGFWKIHILHHAAQGPVVGNWMLQELRNHGYDVSPGTLYPILNRMEENGWLYSKQDKSGGPKARKSYFLTPKGEQVMDIAGTQLKELYHELDLRDGDG
ncbi:MAG: helix-turn-helix transcriptional regulator [Magnetococcales bacterium]|nr:helix-turn-helix transcriptional regulator [Magnetococcales bacterium]